MLIIYGMDFIDRIILIGWLFVMDVISILRGPFGCRASCPPSAIVYGPPPSSAPRARWSNGTQSTIPGVKSVVPTLEINVRVLAQLDGDLRNSFGS